MADNKKLAKEKGAEALAKLVKLAPTEAGSKIIPRAETIKILKEVAEDTGLNINKLLQRIGIKPEDVFKGPEYKEKIKDVLGHLILEKTGKAETEVIKAGKQLHPEVDVLNIPVSESKSIGTDLGQVNTPQIRNRKTGESAINRFESKIDLSKNLDPYPLQKASTMAHEGAHVTAGTQGKVQLDWPGWKRDAAGMITPNRNYETERISILLKDHPEMKEALIKNFEQQGGKIKDKENIPDQVVRNIVMNTPGGKEIFMGYGNVPVNAQQMAERPTAGHHGLDTKNYELEKIKELHDKGIVTATPEEIQKNIDINVRPEAAKYHEILDRLGMKKTAAAAAGVGTAAALGAPGEAQAQEPGSLSTEPQYELPDLPPETEEAAPLPKGGPGLWKPPVEIQKAQAAQPQTSPEQQKLIMQGLQTPIRPTNEVLPSIEMNAGDYDPIDIATDLVSYPQRKALASLAQKVGVEGDVLDENKSSIELVDAMAKKLNVPADSIIGNIAKAGLSAGVTVFADPASLVGLSQTKKGKQAISKLGDINKGLGEIGAIGKIEKAGTLKKGALGAEWGLAPQQKVVQKLTNAADFSRARDEASLRKELTEQMNKYMASPAAQANFPDRAKMQEKAAAHIEQQVQERIKKMYGEK